MEFEQPQGQPQGRPETEPAGKARGARRWLRGRPVRWVAAGAAAVVVAGGAAVAVHHVAEGHGDRREASAADHGHGHGGYGEGGRGESGRGESGWGESDRGEKGHGGNGQGHRGGHDGRDGGREDGDGARGGEGTRGAGRTAPAPLPSTDAADAVAKAAAAVSGGKVESLSPATEQGGGRAWQAVVVGPDGVRHLVTVDGTSGAVTGNTVLGG